MLRILLFQVGREPIVSFIENTLEGMQKAVGGYIELVDLGKGCSLYLNEEGKLQNLSYNRCLPDDSDYVAGDFFVCSTDEDGENENISDEQIRYVLKLFKLIE